MIWIACAVVFVVVIFLAKTTSIFQNIETYQKNSQTNGLIYDNIALQDAVNKDTDQDGILDWEENLYGLDPTKKETTLGVPDTLAINKLRSEDRSVATIKNNGGKALENLTQTDKFSRELFATVAAASQNGAMDQQSIDKLTASLADNVQNSPQRKIFSILDIKTINDNSVQAFKNYNKALSDIYKKYPPISYTVLDVLQKFVVDENTVDASALLKLDPIIAQAKKVEETMIKTSAPQSISTLHLNVLNSLEGLIENLSDIKLYDSDAIVALGGISKYEQNSNKLESDLNNLANMINQKLKN